MDVAGLNDVIAAGLMKTSREAAVCSLQRGGGGGFGGGEGGV